MVLQMVVNVKVLLGETELLLAGKMSMVTVSSSDTRSCDDIGSLSPYLQVTVTSLLVAAPAAIFALIRCVCVCVQQLDPPQQEQLNAALGSVALQLRRLADVSWLCPAIDPSDIEVRVGGRRPARTVRKAASCDTRVRLSVSSGSSDGRLQEKPQCEIPPGPEVQEGQKQ